MRVSGTCWGGEGPEPQPSGWGRAAPDTWGTAGFVRSGAGVQGRMGSGEPVCSCPVV